MGWEAEYFDNIEIIFPEVQSFYNKKIINRTSVMHYGTEWTIYYGLKFSNAPRIEYWKLFELMICMSGLKHYCNFYLQNRNGPIGSCRIRSCSEE